MFGGGFDEKLDCISRYLFTTHNLCTENTPKFLLHGLMLGLIAKGSALDTLTQFSKAKNSLSIALYFDVNMYTNGH